MCTYNISLSDASVDRIRPAFKDAAAVQAWLREQLEILVMQFNVENQNVSVYNHSLSHLRGILSESGMTEKQLREEWVREKYGV